jgi:hypothetical protein
VRCAIHLRGTAIRISSVPRFTSNIPFVKIPSWDKVMGFAEYFCRPDHFWILSKYGHILGKTLCSGPGRRPGQASPWGHKPSSSAPCAVPMRLSRIDQHIKDEPCAKQPALIGVSSSRFSSVSRGVRSAVPIFTFSPLVPGYRYPDTRVLYIIYRSTRSTAVYAAVASCSRYSTDDQLFVRSKDGSTIPIIIRCAKILFAHVLRSQ